MPWAGTNHPLTAFSPRTRNLNRTSSRSRATAAATLVVKTLRLTVAALLVLPLAVILVPAGEKGGTEDALPYANPSADREAVFAPVIGHPSPAAGTNVMTGELARLKDGLDALRDGRIADAKRMRDALPETALERRILAWSIAVSGAAELTSNEIAAAAQATPSWPGRESLRAASEKALARQITEPRAIIAAFSGSVAETLEGATALARANIAVGDLDGARAALRPIWHSSKLDTPEEKAVIAEFGAILDRDDHLVRMQAMLLAERVASAGRVAELAGALPLFEAWSAVLRRDAKASALLDGVTAQDRHAGWYFAKARHERRRGDIEAAARAMLAAPVAGHTAVDDSWWTERRALSRELIDIGDWNRAYQVAAAHHATSPAIVADAEFHAGWYALVGLKDPKSAARHFARIADIAKGAMSLSRAHYWLGRAAEAAGEGAAEAHYERAAVYSTSFYGQIAAAKLGLTMPSPAMPSPSPSDRLAFENRELVQVIRSLEQIGHGNRAGRFYMALAQQVETAGEAALLVAMGEARSGSTYALRLAKSVSARGIDIGALSHPLGAIPDSVALERADRALAYAIARQESEFNTGAVSGAGALGLLQLLPGTAKDMARKAGLPYSATRLTSDAGYNATLGSAFLAEQLSRFAGSYVMTFAGYNAGPRRAIDWAQRYGDPRGQPLDAVVDWIERIPFTETRNYVQRVMENYQVYKALLDGEFDIAGDLTAGR